MLSFTPLKNVEKVTVEFEIEGRKVKAKLESPLMASKIDGMNDLVRLFGMCKTF